MRCHRWRHSFPAALGLLVGIAGLGVVMVRAVRERRRNIGVLRALGFQAGTVQRAFLTESSLVALEGILFGSALGLVTAYLQGLAHPPGRGPPDRRLTSHRPRDSVRSSADRDM